VLPELSSSLHAELARLDATHRLRACPPHSGPTRTRTEIDGRHLISFSSNDYLGLAAHPALSAAAAAAALQSGFGAGASRLVSGDLPEHRALEAQLASFLGAPAALLFPTGYQANIGLLTALAGPEDLVVSDSANHASIIDGCRLCRATIVVYPHRDVSAASSALARAPAFRRSFLVTESVFSMDGDAAPLADLRDITIQNRAALLVDEAHALGALGPGGRGLWKAAGIVPAALVGTLGKAFGTFGGFVAGVPELRAILVNRARSFLFTTAQPPPLAAASSAALAIITGVEGDARRARLLANIAKLAALIPPAILPLSSTTTPILPVLLGSDQKALAASAFLRERGAFVQAIRPPTVPPGTARLRLTLTAEHQPSDLHSLAEALRMLESTL
jgi:8-amino-7-oxononanoate synthase